MKNRCARGGRAVHQ